MQISGPFETAHCNLMLLIYSLNWDDSSLNTDILMTDITGVPSV